VRQLVAALEQAAIDLLAEHRIAGERRPGAPGVYVAGAKIAALGLRVRNGCSYHGLALNVAMDLGPFRDIDPCGYAGLAVTQLADLGVGASVPDVGRRLAARIAAALGADRA
jgi:lipoyl(octanoyl) transferase